MVKIVWGPEGGARTELNTLVSALPALDRRSAKMQIKAALQLCREPLGHPEADNRSPLIAIPGYRISRRGAERWITIIVGLMDVSVIPLRVCEGRMQPSEDDGGGFHVVVDDSEWERANDLWGRGRWDEKSA